MAKEKIYGFKSDLAKPLKHLAQKEVANPVTGSTTLFPERKNANIRMYIVQLAETLPASTVTNQDVIPGLANAYILERNKSGNSISLRIGSDSNNVSVTVYNLTSEAITVEQNALIYVHAVQDMFGDLWVIDFPTFVESGSSGSGSGSGSGGSGGSTSTGNCVATSFVALTGVSRSGDNLIFTRAQVNHDKDGCTSIASISSISVDVCDCTAGSGSGSGSGSGFGDCDGCEGTPPETLIVEDPTVTNNNCFHEDNVNLLANRTMTRVDTCTWEGPLFLACVGVEAQWRLTYSLGTWELRVLDTSITYTVVYPDAPCSTGFTLNLQTGGSEYSSLPATLDVTP